MVLGRERHAGTPATQESQAEPGGEPLALPGPATTGPTGSTRRGKTSSKPRRRHGAAVCLVPELIKSVCADTALRANQV